MSEAKIVFSGQNLTRSAFAEIKGDLGGLHTMAESVKGTLETLGITLSAGYFAELIKGTIDANEHLQNLHVSTDLSVTDLAGLRLLAKQTGTDLDGLARGVNRMSVEIGKSPEKFRALGITATDSKGALKQFADIFNLLPDIQLRNALAQAVFQKSWAEMAPTLAKGSKGIEDIMEKGARLSGVDAELTSASAAFNDKLAELTGTHGLMNKEVATLLPLLNSLAGDLLDMQEKSAAAGTSFNGLLITVQALVVFGANVAFVFRTIGREIGGLMAQADTLGVSFGTMMLGPVAVAAALAKTATKDIGGALTKTDDQRKSSLKLALDIGAQMRADSAKDRAELDVFVAKVMTTGTAAKATGKEWQSAFGAMASDQNAAALKKQQDAAMAAARALLDAGRAQTDAQSAYDRIIKSIREKIAADDEELALGRKLTDQEKFEAKVKTDLGEISKGVSEAEKKRALDELERLHKKANALAEMAALINNNANYAKEWAKDEADLAAFEKARGDERDRLNATLLQQKNELQDNNTLLQMEGSLVGATDKERSVALGQLQIQLKLMREIDSINQNLMLTPEAKAAAITAATANAEMAKQQVTMRANNDEMLRDWQRLDTAGHDVFASLFEKGGDTLHKLGKLIKTELIDELYKLTAQKWIFQIFANITGAPGASGLAGSAVSSAGGSAISGAAGNFMGLGAASSALSAGATGAEIAMAGGTTFGSVGAAGGFGAAIGTGATGAAGAAGSIAAGAEAAMAAIPVVGWVALAGLALYSIFGGKGGGPKITSAFGPDLNPQDRLGDPTQAKGVVDTLNTAYANLAHTIGLTNDKLNASVLISTDPQGKAQTILEVASTTANYSRGARLGGVENVGRSDAELQAALAEETTRIIFAALKQSNLSEVYKSWLDSVGNNAGVAEMQAAIDHISRAAAESQQLQARLFDLTATDLQKLNKTREAERAAVDASNRALLEQVYAQQDLAKVTENTNAQIMADLQAAHDAVATAREKDITALQSTATATESAAAHFRSLVSTLRGFRDSLLLGDLSPLTPGQKYAAASQQFEATYAAAQAGDADAMDKLQQVSTDFLQASQVYNASGSAYQSDFARVQTALTLAATKADAMATANEAQLAVMNAQLTSLQAIHTDGLTIAEAIDKLAIAVKAALNAGLNPGTDNLATLTGGVTGQFVDTAAGAIYTSAAGASLTAGKIYAINGQSYTPQDAYAYIQNLLSQGRDTDAYYAFKSAGISLSDADKLMNWEPMFAENWATSNGLPVFASGAAFTSGVVRRPTVFNMGMMGEASPEAIMPLANVGGQLGVRTASGGGDPQLRALMRDVVTAVRALAAQHARGTDDVVMAQLSAAQVGADRLAKALASHGSKTAWERRLDPEGQAA